MSELSKSKVAIVWRGEPGTTLTQVPETSRLHPVALACKSAA